MRERERQPRERERKRERRVRVGMGETWRRKEGDGRDIRKEIGAAGKEGWTR